MSMSQLSESKSNSKLKELPSSTVRLIGSTQIIVSVFSVAKELIENALDANATTIDIKLENFGLDKIEVRDNGDGIAAIDVPFATKRFATSKISDFTDLLELASYGFRGEALGSLCSVSDVTITTKTSEDDVSLAYTFDGNGEITVTQPSHLGKGTTVCACNLFKKLPVRRQYYNTIKKKKDELKKVEDLIVAFGVIHPNLRLTLHNNKDLVLQKNLAPDLKSALSNILGRSSMLQMTGLEFTVKSQICVEVYVPQPDCDLYLTSRSTNDRCLSYINKRPVHIKAFEKVIKEYYVDHLNCSVSRFPIFLMSITAPPSLVDFNIDPNKTIIKISGRHQDFIRNELSIQLQKLYEGDRTQSVNTPAYSTGTEHRLIPKKSAVNTNWSPASDVATGTSQNTCDGNKTLILDEKVNGSSLKIIPHQTNQCAQNGGKNLHGSRYNDSANSSDLLQPGVVQQENIRSCSGNGTLESGENRSDMVERREFEKLLNTNCFVEDEFDEVEMCFELDEDDFQRTDENKTIEQCFSSDKQKTMSDMDTNSAVETFTDFTDTQTEQWSRGHGLKSTSGTLIQPVTLLAAAPSSVSLSNTKLSAHLSAKRKSMALEEDQPTLYDLISHKPSKRQKSLSGDCQTKDHNEAECDKNETMDVSVCNSEESCNSTRMEEQAKKPKVLNSKTKRKLQPENSSSIIEKLWQSSRTVSSEKCNPATKSVGIPFNFTALKKKFLSSRRHSQAVKQEYINVIGCVKTCGVWFCTHGNRIALLNHHRVAETVIYYELVSNFMITAETLDEPIQLTERNVTGTDIWQTLIQMVEESSLNMSSRILDKRFVGNGIDIRFHADSDGDRSVVVHGLAKSLPIYDISDVVEVLTLITNSQAQSLAQARPLKAITFLQGEAVRMARKLPTLRSRVDIEELLGQMQLHLPKGFETCIHDKPFFHYLYNLDDLPLTQTQSQS